MARKPRATTATLSQAHVRVAIYTRRSTDEENQPFTIEAQESKLDSYAASQEGWSIVAKYSDDASGAKIDRPDLARALAAARAGKFDVLLVYRVDRFSRRIPGAGRWRYRSPGHVHLQLRPGPGRGAEGAGPAIRGDSRRLVG